MNSPFGRWSGSDFFQLPLTPSQFVIDQWLRCDDALLIVGKEGIGKSTLLLQMIGALVTGQPFLQQFAILAPRHCTYIQLEGDKFETRKRLLAIQQATGFVPDRFLEVFLPGQNLQTDEGFEEFLKALRPLGEHETLFIDPFYALFPGTGNDDAVIKPVMNNLRRLREEINIPLVIGHHIRKSVFDQKSGHWLSESSEDALGSRLIAGWFDSMMLLSEASTGLRSIKSSKGRKGGYFDSLRLGSQEVQVSLNGSVETEEIVTLFQCPTQLPNEAHDLLMWLSRQVNFIRFEQMVEVSGKPISTLTRWLKMPMFSVVVRTNPGHRPAQFVHRESPAYALLKASENT